MPRSEQAEYSADGDTKATNTGLAPNHSRIKRDSINFDHLVCLSDKLVTGWLICIIP